MSLFSASYLVYFRPFETPQQNFVEVFNELMVLIGSYHMLMLTSLEPI
jgi:uncharacterized protein YhhL (DUF1145 family)